MTPGRCNQLLQHLTLIVQAHSPSAVDTSAVSISQQCLLDVFLLHRQASLSVLDAASHLP